MAQFMKNYKGKSFIVIMIVIAISALFLRIAIEQIVKINIEQNQSNAQTTLKLISTALENYSKDNHGSFPAGFSVLTQKPFRYLDKDYISASPVKGYNYTCSKINPSGYNCTALPVICNLTGKLSYVVSTGGLFISEECNK